MTTRYKLILGAAALIAVLFASATLIENRRTRRLETAVETARSEAARAEQSAGERETEAAAYKQKNEYLEKSIAEIRAIAAKHDEELEIFANDTRDARRAYDRARGARSIALTTEELCAKLAELGHPCQ